jgi:hypothetical protein
MGFGQLPPGLFFADKLKPRETINNAIEYNRILHFEQTPLPEAIVDGNVFPLLPQFSIIGGKNGVHTSLVKQYLSTVSL